VNAVRLLEADEATVAFDFHDPTGATTPFGIQTEVAGDGFDEGTVDTGLETFEADLPGGLRVFDRDGLSLIEWEQELAAPTMDVLEQGLNEMIRLLRDPPGPLLLQKVGGTALYADVLGARTLAPALRGQERALFLVNTQLFVLDYPITLVRQPGFRTVLLAAAVNQLTNPTLLIDTDLNGTPDGWTAGSGTGSIVAAEDAYQNSHTAAANLLTQTIGGKMGTHTFSAWARRVSGTGTGRIQLDNGAGGDLQSSADITSAAWQRYTVSRTNGAPGDMRAILRQQAAGGTTVLQFARAQLEAGAAATPFRVGRGFVTLDPTVV
jgi:hypothetical protein